MKCDISLLFFPLLDTKKMKSFSCHVLCFNKLYISFIQLLQPLAIHFLYISFKYTLLAITL